MRPVTVTVGPLVAANATNIRTASGVGGAGALVLNGTTVSGGVATLDKARRVLITSVGNDSGITFTITGTDINGNVQSEVLTGPNATTAQSVLSYKTVTSIVASGASAGNVSVGTSGVADAMIVRLDDWALQRAGLQVNVSAAGANYTVSFSDDDPNSPTNPVATALMNWINSSDAGVVAASTNKQSVVDPVTLFARLTLNSGTGSATMTIVQMGAPPL